jgi:putative ABC transport system substrate-binding protein
MPSLLSRVLIALCGALAVCAQAQQPNAPRIGFLSAVSYEAFASRIDAFRQGLKELGYIEGKNIIVEYRWAEGRPERLPALAAELERLNVRLIVSAGPSATRPARQATKTTPIVMGFDSDPVGSGFVDSLARPGGRITGLSILSPEVSAKQVDVLRQIIPGLARIVVLGDSKEPGNGRAVEETREAAHALGLQAHYVDIRAVKTALGAISAARKEGAHALILLPSPFFFDPVIGADLLRFTAAERLPAMYWGAHFVDRGGLMSYSANMDDLFRRAAIYVDKILKGAKAGDLPVEQPFKFEFVINLKAAKEIGLTIPMSVLTRADRVVQ